MSTSINKIIEGDCLDVLKRMPSESIDLVFTSPPYADRRRYAYGGIRADEYNDWFVEIAYEIKRVLKPTGSFFLNIKAHAEDGQRHLYVYELVIRLKKEVGFRFIDDFVWTKIGFPGRLKGRFKNAHEPIFHFTKSKNFTHNPYAVGIPPKEESLKRARRKESGKPKSGSGMEGMRYDERMRNMKLALPSNHIHAVQRSNQHTIESRHPAVFPEKLPDFFIKAFSNEGDVVLDPFGGSGTTAKMALLNNRKYIHIDIVEEYNDIARERLEEAEKEAGE